MPESIVGVDFNYTYNGILSKDVLFKPTVMTPAISDLTTIRQFARYKEQIPLINSLEKQVRRYSNCERPFTEGIDINNTTIELTPLELNMQWCKNDFEQTLTVGNNLAEEFLKDGIEEFDPSGTQIQKIIDELVNDVLRKDTFRIISFGDTADADPDWAQLDGMWTKLIASAGHGGTYCVSQVHDFDDELAAGEALTALRAAYEDSPIILKQLPNAMKYFAVTGSVYENLLTSYESNTTGSEKMFLNLVQGQGDQGTSLMYRGIRVMPIYAWDESLADPTNPLNGTVNHLLLYTTRDNHVTAFKRQSDSEKASGFFDRLERKFFIEAFWRMGYNFLHCDLQSIAV